MQEQMAASMGSSHSNMMHTQMGASKSAGRAGISASTNSNVLQQMQMAGANDYTSGVGADQAAGSFGQR